MTFATRLVLAMLAVAVLATAVGLGLSLRQVRQDAAASLVALFRATMTTAAAVQDSQLAAISEECRNLARAPRVRAALRDADPQALYLAAEDLLLPFFQGDSVPGFSPYLFLDAQGAVVAPGSGLPAVDAAVARLLPRGGEPWRQRVAYLAALERPWILLLTAVDEEDERLGTLATLVPYRVMEPAPGVASGVADGGAGTVGAEPALRSGLLIGSQLFTPAESPLPLPAAALLEIPERGEGTEMSTPEGGALAFSTLLAAQEPPVRLVTLASLAPMTAAQRRLTLFALAGLAAAALLGLGASVLIGRGLARPVGDLAEAASRVERGEYDVRVPLRGGRELALLAGRFNHMAEGLALRDRYRSVLDAVTDPEVARELVAGPAVPGGRIRRVAILFCDIRGFTALTERRGAEEVVGLLNRHMEAMCEEIRRHGGVVDKFVGDLVMATFGTVREAADDARRAAACAVAMQRSRAALNAADATPIQVGVGVSFGDVVAGCMGGSRRLDYTVVGERVNLASRLCGAARAGEVVVDDATRAALPAEWPAEALPPMQVKGFSQPVLAFRLPVDSAP